MISVDKHSIQNKKEYYKYQKHDSTGILRNFNLLLKIHFALKCLFSAIKSLQAIIYIDNGLIELLSGDRREERDILLNILLYLYETHDFFIKWDGKGLLSHFRHKIISLVDHIIIKNLNYIKTSKISLTLFLSILVTRPVFLYKLSLYFSENLLLLGNHFLLISFWVGFKHPYFIFSVL